MHLRSIILLCLMLIAPRAWSVSALTIDSGFVHQDLINHFDSVLYADVVKAFTGDGLDAIKVAYDQTGRSNSLWFKFSVFNSSRQTKLILSSDFPLKTMLVIDAAKQKEIARTGGGIAQKDKIFALSSSAKLEVPPGLSTFYLAIDVDGNPFLTQFELYSENEFLSQQKQALLVFAVFIGGMIAMALNMLLFFFVIREKVIIALAVTILSYVCLEATISGFPLLLEPPYSHRLGDTWLLWNAICMIGITLLTMRFFSIKRAYPKLYKAWLGFLIVSTAIPMINKIQPAFFSLLYIFIETAATASFIGVAFKELKKKNRMAIGYILAYVPILLVVFAFFLQVTGLIPKTISFETMRLGAAVLMALELSVGLLLIGNELLSSHQSLRNSLAGLISEKQIDRLISQGGQFSKAPTNRYITVMMIDIVGYSRTIKAMTPLEGFMAIHEILNEVTAVIHKYDGVIDRSLGDGILCFFCHDFLGVGGDDHEHRAFLSAVEIQQNSVKRVNQMSNDDSRVVFPLRIGINSATVCIGNLGEENRLEIALAGEGVFLAEKFEIACEPHKIIVSKSTYQALPEMVRESSGFCSRHIPLASQENLLEGFEFDPFFDEPEVLVNARDVFWKMSHADKRHVRHVVARGDILFDSRYGAMAVVNFSHGGFCLRSRVFLGRGTVFNLALTPYLEIKEIDFISPVVVEVVWGIIENRDGFLLGVQLTGLNDLQKSIILQTLHSGLWAKTHPIPALKA